MKLSDCLFMADMLTTLPTSSLRDTLCDKVNAGVDVETTVLKRMKRKKRVFLQLSSWSREYFLYKTQHASRVQNLDTVHLLPALYKRIICPVTFNLVFRANGYFFSFGYFIPISLLFDSRTGLWKNITKLLLTDEGTKPHLKTLQSVS